MHKLYYLAIIFILTCSCSKDNRAQLKHFEKLKLLDSLSFNNPLSVGDSLRSINFHEFSKSNRAYYTLLETIVNCRGGAIINNDSSIIESIEFYRSKSDFKNLFRSLVFSSHASYNKKYLLTDSLTTQYLNEAKLIFERQKINDPLTEAYLYKFIAANSIIDLIKNKSRGGFITSLSVEENIEKSVAIFHRLGLYREAQLALIFLSEMITSVYEYNKELEILDRVAAYPNIDPDIRQILNRRYIKYYNINDDYDKIIYYNHLILSDTAAGESLNRIKDDAFLDLSSIYSKLNQTDSAIFYAIKYKDARLKDARSAHLGYNHLSKIYESSGYFREALEYHSKSATLSLKVFRDHLSENLRQKREENEGLKKEIKSYKSRINLLAIFFLVALIITTFTLIYSIKQLRKTNFALTKEVEILKSEITLHEDNEKKMWVITEVLKTTAGAFPILIKDVLNEAGRCRKESKETYENLNNHVDNIKSTLRDIIPEIAKSKVFTSTFPDIASKDELSPYEKIIHALYMMGYDAKSIANIFSVSPSTIRSVKARVKEKQEE